STTPRRISTGWRTRSARSSPPSTASRRFFAGGRRMPRRPRRPSSSRSSRRRATWSSRARPTEGRARRGVSTTPSSWRRPARPRGAPRCVLRARVVRRAAHRPADRRARTRDAGQGAAGAEPRRDAAALAPGDAREARGQRRHGGVRARVLSRRRRRRRGDARARLQPLRRPGDDPSGGAALDRPRTDRARARRARGLGVLRAGLPRERDDRTRHPPDPHEPRRRVAGPIRHGDQGSPAKFTYCIAEREDASPWGPLRGGESAVTVFGGEAPHNVNDHVSTGAAGILATVADTAVSLGSNVGWYFSQSQLLIVLGPEHAATIAGDGFTRADVQRYVFEHARLPLRTLKLGGMWGIQDW